MSTKYVGITLRAKQKVFVEVEGQDDNGLALDAAIDLALEKFNENGFEFLEPDDACVMSEEEFDIELERRTSQAKLKLTV